jgi:preprotein translocase subunit SecY
LIDDGSKLAELLGTQVDQLNVVNIMLIFVMITTFSVFLAVIYFQTFRRTLKSINELRAGTDIIGLGNLDFKLKDNKKMRLANYPTL